MSDETYDITGRLQSVFFSGRNEKTKMRLRTAGLIVTLALGLILKAAKALGLTTPQSLLIQADQVIP